MAPGTAPHYPKPVSLPGRVLAATLVGLAACAVLWLHARSFGLGGRTPLLDPEGASYALAAKELAAAGRFQTPSALPLDLVRHPLPPWPLAGLEPGLVAADAALFRAFGAREELVLAWPLMAFAALAVAIWVAGARISSALGATVAALGWILDPVAQHRALAGTPEAPAALLLFLVLAAIASGWPERHPFGFGLLVGAGGLLRLGLFGVAPVLCAAAAVAAPRPERGRVLGYALLGAFLLFTPVWAYRAASGGTLHWHLVRSGLWNGVDGSSWLMLTHVPQLPPLPDWGSIAAKLIGKAMGQFPSVLFALTEGARGTLIVALLAALLWLAPSRPLAWAGWCALLTLAFFALGACFTTPSARQLLAARAPVEAGGLWGLLALLRAAPQRYSPRLLRAAALAVVLTWALFQDLLGFQVARQASQRSPFPSPSELDGLARSLAAECTANEVVMSNLGPLLAWKAHRPVLDLALSPADLEACRHRVEFRRIVLVYRDPGDAWPQWREVVLRGGRASLEPEWNIAQWKNGYTAGGFRVVWLVLGDLPPRFARAASLRDDASTRSRSARLSARFVRGG